MSDPDGIEPERYELDEPAAYHFETHRRDFLKLVGSGLVLVLALPEARAQESGRGGDRQLPREIAAWLHIGEDGSVTVFTGKTEMGQDIRTSLSQAVAEELRAPMASIRLVMADTDLTPYDAGTFGSRTTPVMNEQLRKVSAAARETLVELAAQQWQVEKSSITVEEGTLRHAPTSRALSFGALTKGQKLVRAVADEVQPAPAERWKVLGRPEAKVNGREIVSGRHKYTSDLAKTGMWHGRVLRAPAMGASLASLDTSSAALAGLTLVRDGDFVGVAAASAAAATQVASALKAEWKTSPQPSHREVFEYLKKTPARAAEGRRPAGHVVGSVAEARAAAEQRLERTYKVAYIAHVPLEPRAALAEWNDGRLTVWTGTQRPFGVRGELAEAFHLPEDRVRVIVPDTGSAYGGKHSGEVAVEAARLAKAAGRPVRVVWTREEEFAWAYFRPGGVIEVMSGAAKDGTLTAWEFHNYNSGTSAIRTPYEVPNQKIEFHAAQSPLRQGSYRGLAATANTFAREAHMDELARRVGLDAVAFRHKNLKDARLRAVLDAAAARFGWSRPKTAADRGVGIACGTEKGSYVASAAEVSVDEASRRLRVLRVVTAFECGAIVNPDCLRNQVEGAVVMGLGGALFEQVRFEEGRILSDRLSRYRVPRFSDVPDLETVLLDRRDLPPAGAGETPIIAVAPALANAIFDAAGVRLCDLPLVPEGVIGAKNGGATSG